MRTMRGVCQGLIDIYNDELEIYKKGDKKEDFTWNKFKDKFLIVCIADGFKELTSKTDPESFPPNAKNMGIFDSEIIEQIYCNKTSDNKYTVKSIEEIAKTCTRLYPETSNLF